MRRLVLEADKQAAVKYADLAERRPHNGHDRPSAYLDGFLAGVRHVRRNPNIEERQEPARVDYDI